MKTSSLVVLLSVGAPIALSVACGRDEAPPAVAKAPSPPPPPPLPLGAVPGGDDHTPDAGAGPELIIVPTGEWSENRLYKFRLERLAACGAPAQTAGPVQPAAAGAPAPVRGQSSWVGAFFSVQAKEPTVFVTPRDLELRRGGVILSAKYINQPLLPGCQPLLPAKRLRAGESVGGFALFEVPGSFRKTTDDPIVLSYKPTRWGGARRVEVPIRECLDACPEPPAKSTPSKTAARAARPRAKL